MEHSAILLTLIKLPFVIKILFLSGHFTQVLHRVTEPGSLFISLPIVSLFKLAIMM